MTPVAFYFSWISYPSVILEYVLYSLILGINNRRKQGFVWRIIASSLCFVALSWIIEIIANLVFGNPIGYNSDASPVAVSLFKFFFHIFMVSMAMLVLLFSYKEDAYHSLVALASAFSIQHIRATLTSRIAGNLHIVDEWAYLGASMLIKCLLVAACCGLAFLFVFRRGRLVYQNKKSQIRNSALYVGIVFISLLLMIAADFSEKGNPLQSFSTTFSKILSYGLILAVQFSVIRHSQIIDKAEKLEGMYKDALEQNKMDMEARELLNIKAHDAKHGFNSLNDDEKAKAILDHADCLVRCGYPYLDTILSHYMIECREKGIEFTCIIDGSAFSFLDLEELQSLFGNLLSNAIEALEKSDLEPKEIMLRGGSKLGFAFLHEENPSRMTLDWDGGLPETDKEDKKSHGYGTKSMKRIASIHNGDMKMDADGTKFSVDFLFPKE